MRENLFHPLTSKLFQAVPKIFEAVNAIGPRPSLVANPLFRRRVGLRVDR